MDFHLPDDIEKLSNITIEVLKIRFNDEFKDINIVTDVTNIKRAVRNLVLTNIYEKPFHPEIHSGVRDMLFENMTPFTAQTLQQKITDVITNFEPRALLTSVEVIPRFDTNQYEVIVEFYIQNAPTELVDLSFTLERLR